MEGGELLWLCPLSLLSPPPRSPSSSSYSWVFVLAAMGPAAKTPAVLVVVVVLPAEVRRRWRDIALFTHFSRYRTILTSSSPGHSPPRVGQLSRQHNLMHFLSPPSFFPSNLRGFILRGIKEQQHNAAARAANANMAAASSSSSERPTDRPPL